MIIPQEQSGFILLMSSIVLSAVLVAVVFSLSFSGFFTRFNLLDSANKESSLGLAEACAQIAVLKKQQDMAYLGNETIMVGSESCQVLPIENLGSEVLIKTRAEDGGAISNIQINLNFANLEVLRWREVANF